MSLVGLKRDLETLKEHVKLRPVNVLLQTKAELLTDSEIDKVLNEVPLQQIPSDIILAYFNREHGTSYTLDSLPLDMSIEWRDLEE